jgi:hypothetical protein
MSPGQTLYAFILQGIDTSKAVMTEPCDLLIGHTIQWDSIAGDVFRKLPVDHGLFNGFKEFIEQRNTSTHEDATMGEDHPAVNTSKLTRTEMYQMVDKAFEYIPPFGPQPDPAGWKEIGKAFSLTLNKEVDGMQPPPDAKTTPEVGNDGQKPVCCHSGVRISPSRHRYCLECGALVQLLTRD